MQQVKANDQVTVLYDGLLDNGEIFESSNDTGPLEFTLGANSVHPFFEEAVLGMQVGETRTVVVSADHVFGPRREELVQTLERALFEGHPHLKPGIVLGLKMEKEGKEEQVPAMVTAMDDKTVTVDFNHPLAGRSLAYRITLQAVRAA